MKDIFNDDECLGFPGVANVQEILSLNHFENFILIYFFVNFTTLCPGYAEIIDGQQNLVENQNDAKKTDDYRALA